MHQPETLAYTLLRFRTIDICSDRKKTKEPTNISRKETNNQKKLIRDSKD